MEGNRLEGGVGGVGRAREEGEGRVSVNGDGGGEGDEGEGGEEGGQAEEEGSALGRCGLYNSCQKSLLTSVLAKNSSSLHYFLFLGCFPQ